MDIEYFNKSGQILAYKGAKYSFIFTPGYYVFELWGAAGGGPSPGFGAYVSGSIKLERMKKMHIYIGQKGINGGTLAWNGGGKGNSLGSSGGGSTDVRLVDGDWNDFQSLKSRIIVAAAGGGSNLATWVSKGGNAGILTGYRGSYSCTASNCGYLTIAEGGSQDKEGKAGYGAAKGTNGTFGSGGQGSIGDGNANGGGSGYFGGGGGATSNSIVGSGAGGSSYISGYTGCKSITKTSTEENKQFLDSPIHYSGIKFINITVRDGGSTSWNGNGQVRITKIFDLKNLYTCKCRRYNSITHLIFIMNSLINS